MDKCMYSRTMRVGLLGDCRSVEVILLLYVDDIVLISTDLGELTRVKGELEAKYQLRDGVIIDKLLGVRIQYDHERKIMTLDGKTKILAILDEHPLPGPSAKSHTPGVARMRLQGAEKGSEMVKRQEYQTIVGKLQYLSNTIRPDITYMVNSLGRHSQHPTREHWEAAFRVLGYLSETKDLALTYSDQPDEAVEY